MFPTSSPAVPLVTASVVACSTTVIVRPPCWLPEPALALTTITSTTEAAKSASAITRFIYASLLEPGRADLRPKTRSAFGVRLAVERLGFP
jgi:hypothetical protein